MTQDCSILRLKGVIQRTGLCRASIYKDQTFPRPIKIGARASGWLACEVDAWVAARAAARDAQRRTN